jgi:NADPH:quinone reductase
MRTMKALQFAMYGPPAVLAIKNLPVPGLKAGEVLVQVHASGINPSDVKLVSGVFKPGLPRVPGRDFAGVAVAGDYPLGEEVWGSGAGFGVARDGSHAEYVVVPKTWLSKKPANLSMEGAAAVGVPYITAWSALILAAQIEAGQTALITGVSGAVGRAGTQIAHWGHAKVIGAGRTSKSTEADLFVNTTDDDWPSQVRALTAGRGVDVVLDTVGGHIFESSLKALAIGGRYIVISNVGNQRVDFSLSDFYHNRSHLIGVDTAKLSGEEIALIMDQLRPGFEGGTLSPPSVRTWALSDAVEAYTAVQQADATAKQVLLPIST